MREFHIWYFWWLIFPIMGFGLAAFRSWLRYRRQKDVLDLLRTYAAQGREAPAEVLAQLALSAEGQRPLREGPMAFWFPSIVLLAFAIGFAVLALLPGAANHRFIYPAVFMGAGGAAFAIGGIVSARLAKRSPPLSEPYGR